MVSNMVSNVQVVGLSKLTTFRRSFNSQARSDSYSAMVFGAPNILSESTCLGPRDLKLLGNLVKSGDSHAKVNRFVLVYHDLKLPRRVWVDYDTYRIGRADIEYMSDSTNHVLSKGTTQTSDYDKYTPPESISIVNTLIERYLSDKTEDNWLSIKSALPEGFLQQRTVMVSYQALRHIKLDRVNHKYPELREYCKWIDTLPYAEYLIG